MDKLQPLINESVQLMLIGMGTVFLILIMLIFIISLVTRVLKALNIEDDPEISRHNVKPSKKPAETSNNEVIAAISAAIATYRKSHPVN